MGIKVTVVVPTKNEEETIGNLLRSLKTINGFDVIVVDDGMDKTKEIARELGAKVLDGKGNESPSVKYGIENCGEYVIVMDADGCLPPETLVTVSSDPKNGRGHYLHGDKFASQKKIKDINVGDIVLSYNVKTGVKEWDKVINKIPEIKKNMCLVKMSNGNELKLTGNHKVFVYGKGWIRADKLSTDDKLIQYRYKGLPIRLWNISKRGKCLNEIHGVDRASEIRKLGGEATKRSYANSDRRKKQSLIISDKWKDKNSIYNTDEYRWNLSDGREGISGSCKGKTYLEIYGSEEAARAFNERRVKAILAKSSIHPNICERTVENILEDIAPGEFKFNDGWFVLDGRIPDFVNINGKKKLIEFNGCYWHSCKICGYGSDEQQDDDKNQDYKRKKVFESRGYDSVEIWEHELNDIDVLKKKILDFVCNPDAEMVGVISIDKYNDEQEVWDIETEKNHNFFAYGILVHNSHPVSILPEMVQQLMDGADLVVGSRYQKGGSRGASTIFSSFGNVFAKLMLRTKTKDLTGRFVAGHKNTLLDNCEWLGRGEDSIDLTYNCFPKGTKIVVEKEHKNQHSGFYCYGSKNIEEIKVGDEVISYNVDTREKEKRKVLSTFKNSTNELLDLKFSNNNYFSVTPNHPVFVVRRNGEIFQQWVEAKDLMVGDSVIQLSYFGLKSHLFAGRGFEGGYPNMKQWCKGKTKETDFRLKEAGRKESITKKEKYSSGDLVAWNKGKTKYDNSSLDLVSKKNSISAKRNWDNEQSTYHSLEYKEKQCNGTRVAFENNPNLSHEKICERMKEINNRPEIRKSRSENAKKNIALRKEIVRGNSKMELKFERFLNDNFKGEWVHTGEGKNDSDWIGNDEIGYVCFDFVHSNGCKKAIEVYADYQKIVNYGSVKRYKNIRRWQAKQRGYDVSFISQGEVYTKDEKQLFDKIENFSFNPNSEVVEIIDIKSNITKTPIDVYNIEIDGNNNYFAYGVLVHNCERRGLKVVEVPFVYEQRQGGQSKTNIGKYLWTYFWRIIGLRLNPLKMFSREYIARGISSEYITSKSVETGKLAGAIYHMQIFPYTFARVILFIPVIGSLFGLFCLNYPKGVVGFFLRGCYWKSKLGFVGKDCFFDTGVSIFPNIKDVYIDDNCFLESNCCIICAKGGVRIGKNCHIGYDTYINGKPYLIMGRYSCIDAGCRVFGSTNLYEDENKEVLSYSSMAPSEMQDVSEIGVKIGRCAFLGPNSVLVCSNIGENSVVGANSFVKTDIPSNSICVGSPAKVIKERRVK